LSNTYIHTYIPTYLPTYIHTWRIKGFVGRVIHIRHDLSIFAMSFTRDVHTYVADQGFVGRVIFVKKVVHTC